MTDAMIFEAFESFGTNRSDWAGGGDELVNIAVEYEDGSMGYLTEPCHALIKNDPFDEEYDKVITRTWNMISHKYWDEGVEPSDWSDAWYKWVMEDSFFSSLFPEKEIHEGNNNVRFIGPVLPSDYKSIGVCANVMLRMPWEYPSRIQSWFRMVEGGVSPESALVLAFSCTIKGDNSFSIDTWANDPHFCFYPMENSKEAVLSFIKDRGKTKAIVGKEYGACRIDRAFEDHYGLRGRRWDTNILEFLNKLPTNVEYNKSMEEFMNKVDPWEFLNHRKFLNKNKDIIKFGKQLDKLANS